MTIGGNGGKWNAVNGENLALLYARIALGAAFLSGIASRFGLYGRDVGYGNFANFEKYTGGSERIYAGFHYSISGVGGDSRRIGLWRLVDRWDMAAPGFLGQCDLAGLIWYRDDLLSGNQISA